MSGASSEQRRNVRTAVVWDDLREVLDADSGAGPLDVLDIGGGTGVSAVRVAGLGHRVTVVDPSPDALASLGRRAREEGVEVVAHQGDLSTLLGPEGLVAPGSADLVLCHGVLEHVADPGAALGTLREVLRPGGTLSLLVAQRHAAVLARALAGHFHQALALLEGEEEPERGRRFALAELHELLPAAGFTVDNVHGIRVFADHVPGTLLDSEPRAAESLAELERAVAERPEFHSLATQLHVLARLG